MAIALFGSHPVEARISGGSVNTGNNRYEISLILRRQERLGKSLGFL
jgi:hypothetical protein